MYKCTQCGATAEQAGNCQTCNVPMVEAKDESATEPKQTTDQPASNEQSQ